MRRQKGGQLGAPMPDGPIHIQPDRVATERASQVADGGQKSIAVAVGVAQHAPPPQQRRDPAEEVQAFSVHAARGHPEALTTFCPAAAQARVQREARLVFENTGLARGQCGAPFL